MRREHREPNLHGRPLPPRLDPRAGRPPSAAAPARPVGAQARRGLRLVRAVVAVLSVTLLAVSGWGWYLGRVAAASVNRMDAIPGGSRGVQGTEMNLLLVGNDSRNDLSKAQRAQLNAGDDGGGVNTDTMIMVHVPADGSRASFVSFPRDSYVQIPGHGWDKLNAAYAYGMADADRNADDTARQAAGAQLLIRTISQLTGLQIHHYAEVDLLGFFQLSSVVGGVDVNLCRAVSDSYSGARFPAGQQTISGADALKFVRQRHGLPRGDFDRIVRQQAFIGGVLRKMLSEQVLVNPAKQHELVQAAARALTVDESLDLMSLVDQMQSVTAGSIQFRTIPYVGDDKDGQGRYILRLQDTATLHQFFAQLSAPEAAAPSPPSPAPAPQASPATVQPAPVRVAVYNGSSKAGLAATAATGLRARGFTVTATGNADSRDHTRSEVRFAAGDDALAATVAVAVPGATTIQAPDTPAGTVQLVLGSDFTQVSNPAAAPTARSTGPVPADQAGRTAADTTCID